MTSARWSSSTSKVAYSPFAMTLVLGSIFGMAGLAGATIVESVPPGTGLMASCFIAPGRGGVGLAGLTFVGIVFGGVILGLTTFWKSGLVCCAVVRGGSIFGTGLCSSLEGGWCGRGVCLSSDFSRDGFDSTIEWPVFRFVEWPAPAPDPGPSTVLALLSRVWRGSSRLRLSRI